MAVDLTSLLLRAAAERPNVLLAAMPGGTEVRLTAERELRERGWALATSQAAADLLLVTGPLLPDLAGPLEAIGREMPAPRARVHITRAEGVAAALDAGRRNLADPGAQRTEVADRAAPRPDARHRPAGHEHRAGDAHGGHAEPETAGAGHGGHEGHGMHDMAGMQMPAGLPMAERGEDRDGLRLDRLHVPLGPILPDWPTGLLLRVTLQGDVIQHAEVEMIGAGPADGPWWTRPWRRAAAGEEVPRGQVRRRRTAARLDSLARLLAVAGWADPAATARRLRDALLAGAPTDRVRPQVTAFAHRVDRSRALRWLTRRVGVLTADEAGAAGVTGPALRADGDVTARYRQWLAEIVGDVEGLDDPAPVEPVGEEGPRGRLDARTPPSAALLTVLPRMLVGAELAGARLIVASLDPDPDDLPPRR